VGAEGMAAFEARIAGALPLSEYLVQQLMAQTDLLHVDGRAKLAALAKPLFARMPDGVLRELLADRLAAEIRMPAAKLKDLLLSGAGQAPREPARHAAAARRPREPMSAGRRNMLSQAISLVLHHPKAASAVERPQILASLARPGIPVLQALIEQARESPNLNTAALLERWRDKPEFERLAQLAADQPLVADPEAAGRELRMAVQRLVETLGPGARMNELLQKAQDTGLNYDEKAELTLLLKSRGQAGSSS